MIWACVGLGVMSLVVSVVVTRVALGLGLRRGLLDSAGVAGQVKAARRRVPNVGGVGLVAGLVVPGGLLALGAWVPESGWEALGLGGLVEHRAGLRSVMPGALGLVGCVAVLHVVGLIDDRRALGPWVKLGVIAGVSLAGVLVTGTRLLTLLDGVVGGAWLSVLVTVVWLVVVINAMNFMDNMDGLAGGVGVVVCGALLASALIGGQWFVAGGVAMLLGATAGFLVWNLPPARVFMGDGGSLVLGFGVAWLAARVTYVGAGAGDGGEVGPGGKWYGVFVPLVALAVPLYDLVSVVVIRLSQGRNPMVGDLQHLSHRLVRRGVSSRAAVVCIWGLTAVTSLGAVLLPSVEGWQAWVIAGQVVVVVATLGAFELASAGRDGGGR